MASRLDQPLALRLWQESVPEPDRGVWESLWWDGRLEGRSAAELAPTRDFYAPGTITLSTRDSWEDDALYLQVLGQGRSRGVPDHNHADAGHFTIFARGELLAFDTAYFNLNEDQHNVVLIDDTVYGLKQHKNLREGHARGQGVHKLATWVHLDCANAKGCLWAYRWVMLVHGPTPDDSYVVVLDDMNKDEGIHSYKWQLHARHGCRLIPAEGNRASVVGERGALDCAFFCPPPEDVPTCPHRLEVLLEPEYPQKPIWEGGSDTSHPRLVAKLDGPNCTLASVIRPRGSAQAPRFAWREPAHRVLDIRVPLGAGVVDQLLFAPDHGLIHAAGVDGCAEVALVRRDARGRVMDAWSRDGWIAARDLT